ncbi:inorganic diphosphatase [Hymenobacter sediminis]|uniref:inorganic diphosphatase n=1 Tax=Hymenobacter sediminis TaxID=2218621 RepID=UPI001EE4A4E6|nr:inorganic diphosphatase [Hymenobacter sediminis]
MLLLTGVGGLTACRTDYADLPTFSAERKLVQVVVEMPAGSNHEQQYNPGTQQFELPQKPGANELIEFLPVPGNLGFIPGTQTAPISPQAPADPIPALVLAESQPVGTVLEVIPVALLVLDVNSNLEPVVLAVPARPAQRILPDATDWVSLNRHYPGVRQSLSLWFQHRNSAAETRIAGWQDEKAADQYIRRWLR